MFDTQAFYDRPPSAIPGVDANDVQTVQKVLASRVFRFRLLRYSVKFRKAIKMIESISKLRLLAHQSDYDYIIGSVVGLFENPSRFGVDGVEIYAMA